MPSKKLTAVLVLATLPGLACGKKKKSDSKDATDSTVVGSSSGGASPGAPGSGLHVSGTIAISAGLVDAPKPNQAWAFPLLSGAAKYDALGMIKQVSLDADGKFDFGFDTSAAASDYVLLL